MSVETRVIEEIENLLGISKGEITLESTRDEIGMDSLDDVEFIMCLEEEFDIEISDADAERITTAKDAVDVVNEYLSA
jgi:acyl carrier protein